MNPLSILDGRKIIKFVEKPSEPETDLAATACYLYSPKDLKLINKTFSKQKHPDNSGESIKFLIENSDVNSVIYEEFWYDIGSLDEYKNVRERYG